MFFLCTRCIKTLQETFLHELHLLVLLPLKSILFFFYSLSIVFFFSILQIGNWKFCGNDSQDECNVGDEGEFIEVSLVIKSKGKPKPFNETEVVKQKKRRPRCFKRGYYNKCPKEFDIGGGSEMVLSSQVKHTLLLRIWKRFKPVLLDFPQVG